MGQIITPPSSLPLTSFSFTLYPDEIGSAVTPQVAEWNGAFPAGGPGTVVWTGDTVVFTERVTRIVAFATGGITIDPAKQYIIQITNPATKLVGITFADTSNYAGGGYRLGNAYGVSDFLFSATFGTPPSVTGLSSATGPAGALVTITGTDFTGATSVTFGGVNAASFTVVSASQINAVVPAGTGAVDVLVTTPVATSANTVADNFAYAAPVPTLGEWAMILFGLLLSGLGALYVRQRHLTA